MSFPSLGALVAARHNGPVKQPKRSQLPDSRLTILNADRLSFASATRAARNAMPHSKYALILKDAHLDLNMS